MILNDMLKLMDLYGQRLPNVYGGVASQGEKVRLLNLALMRVARVVQMFDPKVALTLQASFDTYDLFDSTVVSKKVLQPHAVWVGGSRVNDAPIYGRGPGVYSIQDLEREMPEWRTADPGQPVFAVWENARTLRLAPAPDSTWAGKGQNWVAGVIVPGVIGANGYVADGFTETHVVVAGAPVTATASDQAATVAKIQGSGTLTGSATDIATDDSNYIDYSETYPMAGVDNTMIGVYGFDFSAIPADATINWVQIESMLVASPDSGLVKGSVIAQVVDDATSASPTVFGTLSADPLTGSTFREGGPSAQFSGPTYAQLMSSTFGVQLTQGLYGSGAVSGTKHSRVDYLSLKVSYTYTSAGSDTTTVDLTAKPDLPDDVHEDLCILALVIGANPMATEKDQLQILQNLSPSAMARFEAIGRANMSAMSQPPVIFGIGETGLDVYDTGNPYWMY